jgi:type IV pilus assembly protein PilM
MTPLGFFKQNIIGLDLGSSHIKLLQLQKSGDSYVVRNGISRAIPVTLKKDNTEEKRKFLVGFIKEFLSETRVQAPMGRIALYGKGVFLFFLTVPQLNKKDLQGAVAVELKKRLPFQMDVKNLYFDYFVSGQVKEEKGVNLQITCIAVDKAVVEEQVQILKDLEVTPTGVYVVPDTLGNLLAACVKVPADKTVTLLEIGANTALLNF